MTLGYNYIFAHFELILDFINYDIPFLIPNRCLYKVNTWKDTVCKMYML